MGVEIRVSGPMFNGQAPVIVKDMVDEIVSRVASYALERVQWNLDASIRHPTPYYETQIKMTPYGDDVISVNDSGIVYGPWLEGTGSRNQTTRFKGYASFRRARQATEQAVETLAAPIVARHLGRLS